MNELDNPKIDPEAEKKREEFAEATKRTCACGAEISFPDSVCWVACAACRGPAAKRGRR